MRHHRHVPRCHYPAAARRCRAKRRRGADRSQQLPCPEGRCADGRRGPSRIGRPAVRDPRGQEPAGRCSDRERRRDPDCRGLR